jgi:hypothetical protein
MSSPWCVKNGRFSTDTEKGFAHKPFSSSVRGSVTKKPLIKRDDEGNSLWIEYVRGGDKELFWLMWYDTTGKAKNRVSSVFTRKHLASLLTQLLGFIP